MKKEKWLIGEIESWQKEQLITDETAAVLKKRYEGKQSVSTLVAAFSIIGALLIGAGIILIFAKNWYRIPILVKALLSMLPLFVAQGLSVYVVRSRLGSTAWREGVSIGLSASVFAAMAMVSQTFHIPYDFGTYLLMCGLLILPVIYILNSASPLIVYYYAIINWGALNDRAGYAPVFVLLFLAGAFYVFLNRKKEGTKLSYISWLSAVAGFAAALTLSYMLGVSALLMVLAYFFLLLSTGDLPEDIGLPFKIAGILGALVILLILTYRFPWEYAYENINVWHYIPVLVLLAGGLYFGVRTHTLGKPLLLSAVLISAVIRLIWTIFELDMWPYEFIFMIISNVLAGAVGIGFIVFGVKKVSLSILNTGLAMVCILIILRFFDSEMDFLWRGIVFLVLGAAFLLVNVGIMRYRKGKVVS